MRRQLFDHFFLSIRESNEAGDDVVGERCRVPFDPNYLPAFSGIQRGKLGGLVWEATNREAEFVQPRQTLLPTFSEVVFLWRSAEIGLRVPRETN